MKKIFLISLLITQATYGHEVKVQGCDFNSYREAISLLEEYENEIMSNCNLRPAPNFEYYDRGKIEFNEGNFPCELTAHARMECIFVGW